ncbi:MAG: hypothetical protein NC453_22015 [Muribaculum sp.]|nr:hypothetical protein [Muribaculum sp.]
MSTNNKKLFSPEDFDKEPSEKKSWWKGKKKWVIPVGAVICVIAIVGIISSKSDKYEISETEQSVAVEETSITIDSAKNKQSSENEVVSMEETPSEQISNETAPTATVQSEQNVEASAIPSSNINDVEAEAIKVIRGDYGVGQERKDKLGDRYQPIQNRVNELKREGVF